MKTIAFVGPARYPVRPSKCNPIELLSDNRVSTRIREIKGGLVEFDYVSPRPVIGDVT